jgi:hypothetical protein
VEIDTEKAEQAIKELSDAFIKAFMPVAEAIKNISATLCHTFIDIWESIKEKMPDFEKMKISRKRFVKLLMSIGYQRNEANKIAWRYHEEKGKYTFLDFIIESNKKEV